jgi:hypothetical protein
MCELKRIGGGWGGGRREKHFTSLVKRFAGSGPMNKDGSATAEVQSLRSRMLLQGWKLPMSKYRRVNPKM